MREAFYHSSSLNRPPDRCRGGAILAALYRTLNRKKAEAGLTETLEILQPYGFVRVVADEGAAVEPVLKRILSGVSEKGCRGRLTHLPP